MVMRFYWGLGLGHVYSHQDGKSGAQANDEDWDMNVDSEPELDASEPMGALNVEKHALDLNESEDEGDGEDVPENIEAAAELSLEDRETDHWLDEEDKNGLEFPGLPGGQDDEELSSEEELERGDMYP